MNQKVALDHSADMKIFIRVKSISILFTLLLIAMALILVLVVRQNPMTASTYISLIITFSHLIHTLSWQLSDLLKEYTKKHLYMEDLDHVEQLVEEPGNDGIPDKHLPLWEKTVQERRH